MTLVVAYMRGGSTFTGDVMKQAEGTHYLYEPLHDLSIRIDEGRTVTYMNGSEVKFTNKDIIARIKAEILKHWFLCQPENVDHGSLLVSHFLYHMRELSYHHRCQRQVHGDRVQIIEKCLPFLREKCLAAKIRTIKEISVNMDTIEHLLEILPEVNIIHVVRDPRAIIDSQITSELIDKRKIPQEVDKLCQSMQLNTGVLKKLLDAQTDRLRIITYEDFSLSPLETARDLYNFSGLQFTKRVESFLNRIAMSKGKVHPCRWCSAKGDSKMASVKWRTRITKDVLDIVQKTCGNVMKSYGYKIIKDKATLSDMSVDTKEDIPNVINNIA
ncbi:hypothetical protein FSP39_004142 [Pinctada imbricata]|uniref:Sulfotransferase n=1 Tax=Pinctada imbricata TaxID=66713 RepID=A0AA88YAT1_PINIB|nr:hypothetical protein FSP39_004142 [Pinctada imbricata]